MGGGSGADPPVASKEAAACFLHPTHRTGINGIAWDYMGVNGKRRAITALLWETAAGRDAA